LITVSLADCVNGKIAFIVFGEGNFSLAITLMLCIWSDIFQSIKLFGFYGVVIL